MKANVCSALNRNGEVCGAHRMNGSDFCFFHDPSESVKRKAASAAGGRMRGPVVLPPETPAPRLHTAADVAALLERTIHQVLTGQIDSRIANCVGYLATLQKQVIEQTVLEERLTALEHVVEDPSKRKPFNRDL